MQINGLHFCSVIEHTLTNGWGKLEEFVDVLRQGLSIRSFVPHDYYLFYDDPDIYNQVLKLIDS